MTKANLDSAFESLGLERKTGRSIGSQSYVGTYKGRDVRVEISRRYTTAGGTGPSTYQGSSVTVLAKSPRLATRLTIVMRGAGAELSGKIVRREEVVTGDAAYSDYLIYAREADWARRFAVDEGLKPRILQFMNEPGLSDIAQISVQPGALALNINRVHEGAITAENLAGWLDTATALVEAAERLPEPAEKIRPNFLERATLSGNTGPVAMLALAVFFACVGAMVCPAMALAVFLGTR